MMTGLGEVAAGAQLLEQLGKSIFSTVRAILRAKDDLKSVPEKTKHLITQVEFVDRLLKEVGRTYSRGVVTASPMEIDTASAMQVDTASAMQVDTASAMQVDTTSPMQVVTTAFVNRLEGRISRNEIDRPVLESVLKELHSMLIEVDSKVRKYELDDKEREGKSKTLEVVKNVLRQEGSATKQKENVDQLRAELQKSLEDLVKALGLETYKISVETRDHVFEIHNQVAEIPRAMESVNSNVSMIVVQQQQLSRVQSEYNRHSTMMMEQIKLEVRSVGEKVVRDQEHVNPDTSAPAEIENGMVRKLIEAAYLDSDNDSYLVTVESQKSPEEAWEILEGELAGSAGDATEGNGRRASEAAGYAVSDEGSLRFRMSVNEYRFFHVLTYAHLPGAEFKLYYPTKSDMKHGIEQEDSKVLFPDRNFFKRGPRRFELRKEGSSRKSTESIFLVFSRITLVRADPQHRRKNLEIANVAEELEEHLKKKLCEEGFCYDGIVVKHFLVDIFAKE